MNKYIFFRTDRIGDFLMSSIMFKSIKRSDDDSKIIIVASSKNYDYIKNIDFVDEVILFPETFFKKIIFYLQFLLKKFYLVGILDGKKRSIYFSFLVRSKFKFLFTFKNFYYSFLKLFYTKIFLDKNSINKISEIKELLNIIKIDYYKNDLNTINRDLVLKRDLNISDLNNFILIHFDEKWIFDDYLKTYISIEPLSEHAFCNFLENIILKTNSDLVVSTGLKNNKFINFLMKNFSLVTKNIYLKKFHNKKIFLYNNLSFFELEKLILLSNTVITCHGAPSHVAAAFDKKIIDIIDKSENDFFTKWTAHFRSHQLIFREGFDQVSNKILNLL